MSYHALQFFLRPELLGLVEADMGGVVGNQGAVLVYPIVRSEPIKEAGGGGRRPNCLPDLVVGRAFVVRGRPVGQVVVPEHERRDAPVRGRQDGRDHGHLRRGAAVGLRGRGGHGLVAGEGLEDVLVLGRVVVGVRGHDAGHRLDVGLAEDLGAELLVVLDGLAHRDLLERQQTHDDGARAHPDHVIKLPMYWHSRLFFKLSENNQYSNYAVLIGCN